MQEELVLKTKDKKWLQKNGKKLGQYWEDTKWKRIIFIDVFTWIPFVMFFFSTLLIHHNHNGQVDWEESLLMGLAVACMVGFFTWIVAGVYYNIYKVNSAIFCKTYGEESLKLEDDQFIYKVQYAFSNVCIDEFHVGFDQITGIEINEKLRKLTVYGSFPIHKTRQSKDGKGITTTIFNELGNQRMICQIPMYYDNMEQFIQIISEKSNHAIVKMREIKNPNEDDEESTMYIEIPV